MIKQYYQLDIFGKEHPLEYVASKQKLDKKYYSKLEKQGIKVHRKDWSDKNVSKKSK